MSNDPVFVVLLALAVLRGGLAVLTLIWRDPVAPLDGKAYAFPGFDPIAKQTAALETVWVAILPIAAAVVDLRQKVAPLMSWDTAILLCVVVVALVVPSTLVGAYRRYQSLGLAAGAVIPAKMASGHNYVFIGSGVTDKWLYSTSHRVGTFVTSTLAGTLGALVLAGSSGSDLYALVFASTMISIAIAATVLGSAIHNFTQRDRERVFGGSPPAS